MIEALSHEKILRARNGDAGVIGELYTRYQQSVFRYLYYRVGDIHTAEDLTSEVFLRMLRAINGYQPRQVSFEAWLFQIARNLAIDHYRRKGLHNQVSLDQTPIVDKQAIDLRQDGAIDSQSLLDALNRLNETQRDVIIMRFVNGLPLAQVAGALHKSEDSIKALQRRGLSLLRNILDNVENSND